MADSRPRDIRAGAVSKAILEQSSMDLTNLRIGKQRLVSKKKRMSKLKKTILEDREFRQDGTEQPEASLPSRLSADAPAFLPAEWMQPQTEDVASAASALPVASSLPVPAASGRTGPLPAGPVASRPGQPGETVQLQPEPPQSLKLEPPESAEPAEPTAQPVSEDVKDAEDEAAETDLLAALEGIQLPSDDSEAEVEPMSISETLERLRNIQEKSQPTKQAAKPAANLEVRHYVHQELSDDLDEKVKFVLSELVRFQERAKEQNAMKYAKLKRFCVGLREAKRAITRNKCKGLIVAPNLEVSTAEGGLDDTVEDVIEMARENEVPVIFALSRNRIGKAMGKNIRLSIVALHSVDGVHQQFKEVVKIAEEPCP